MPATAQSLPTKDLLKGDAGVSFSILRCNYCDLIQVDSPPVPYFREVIRASGVSPTMRDFRLQQFHDFIERFGLAAGRVAEIGCGRGEYLNILLEACPGALGVESSSEAVSHCLTQGLRVFPGYPEGTSPLPEAPYDAFILLHFLEHAPLLGEFLTAINRSLVAGAVGLIEVPNVDMILREGLLAEFMTDHLWYFTTATLARALDLYGFDVVDCRSTWHDYAISAIVRKRSVSGLGELESNVRSVGAALREYLDRFPPQSVVAWGAGHQALATMALHGLGEHLAFVVDSATFKQNRFTPASHLPIRAPDSLRVTPEVRAVIVMTGSYADEVVEVLRRDYSNGLSIAVLTPTGLREIV